MLLFVAFMNNLFDLWLWDFFRYWFSSVSELFWTKYAVIFIGLFWVWGLTLIGRFIMSFFGENPWGRANR